MTVFYPNYHDTSSLSPDQVAEYVFQLSFQINDDTIDLHSMDKDVLDALRGYVDAAAVNGGSRTRPTV